MEKIKVGFFGTPDFASLFLDTIIEQCSDYIEVAFVVSQKDKPVGRKHILTASPVKQYALSHELRYFDWDDQDVILPSLQVADIGVVFAFGEILGADILRAPKHGLWNIHPSLLPLYRGASPIAFPLIMNDASTGVTLMKMDEGLDHGPIIAQIQRPLHTSDTRVNLEKELATVASELFKEHVVRCEGALEKIKMQEQVHSAATFTRLLHKNDGYVPLSLITKTLVGDDLAPSDIPSVISWYFEKNKSILEANNSSILQTPILWNTYRAMHPWPGVWTTIPVGDAEKRLKLTDLSYEDGLTTINKVQLEGKTEISYIQFNKHFKIF